MRTSGKVLRSELDIYRSTALAGSWGFDRGGLGSCDQAALNLSLMDDVLKAGSASLERNSTYILA
jgi:hypothetical protein